MIYNGVSHTHTCTHTRSDKTPTVYVQIFEERNFHGFTVAWLSTKLTSSKINDYQGYLYAFKGNLSEKRVILKNKTAKILKFIEP